MLTLKLEDMSTIKDILGLLLKYLVWRLLISLFTLLMMQFNLAHLIMANFKKEIRFLGRIFKNGLKLKGILGFGLNSQFNIRKFAKISLRV